MQCAESLLASFTVRAAATVGGNIARSYASARAGARVLDMEHAFGNLDVGKEADFLLIEKSRWEPLDGMLTMGIRSDDETEATLEELFTLLMGLRQPAIAGVYVQGQEVVTPGLDPD